MIAPRRFWVLYGPYGTCLLLRRDSGPRSVSCLAKRGRNWASPEANSSASNGAEVAPESKGPSWIALLCGAALLHGAALLSARVQLDPSELNRSRLTAYLPLLAEDAVGAFAVIASGDCPDGEIG